MNNLNLIAITENNYGVINGIGNIGTTSKPVDTLASVLSTVIGLLTVIGVLYFIFVLITGAIGIISSGGDKGAFEDARRKITTGVIGLVVVVAAMFIVSLITMLLGLPDFLDLGDIIYNQLTVK